MDASSFITSLQTTLGGYLPKIAGAIGILVIGWLIAVAVRAGTLRLLNALKVDQRINESTGQGAYVERIIAGDLVYAPLQQLTADECRYVEALLGDAGLGPAYETAPRPAASPVV